MNKSEPDEPNPAVLVSAAGELNPAAASAVADKKHIYTLHAREAVDAAELINSALKRRAVGSPARRIQVTAPSGPSTSGGKKARQSITLVPVAGQGPAIMLGYLDVAQRRAELRTFEVVAAQYRARFRKAFEVSAADFLAVHKDLTGMLSTLGFQIHEDNEVDSDSLAPVKAQSSKAPLWAACALVLALVGFLVLLR